MKTTVGALKKLIREEKEYVDALNELFGNRPDFSKLLDDIMGDLQGVNKKVEKAHQFAPGGTAKAVVAGIHSDLFNKIGEFRKYVAQLKGMARGGDKHVDG